MDERHVMQTGKKERERAHTAAGTMASKAITTMSNVGKLRQHSLSPKKRNQLFIDSG